MRTIMRDRDRDRKGEVRTRRAGWYSGEIGLGEKLIRTQARLEVVTDRDDAKVIRAVLLRKAVELGYDAGQIARGPAHPGVLEEAKLFGREFVLGSFFRGDDALAALIARHLDPAKSEA